MKFGSLLLKNNIFLAPMAGITNLPYRLLLRGFGCGLAFSEMVSATGLTRKSFKSFQYLQSTPNDRPLAVQLFGSDPIILAEGARVVAEQGADAIDINMGCPVRKVVRMGSGSALMKNPAQVAEIITAVRKAVSVPLSVKIRSGWSSHTRNAPEIAAIAEACGVDAVIVHPRTTDQGFSGQADWTVIQKVKQNITVPVIGSGDIRSATDAARMMQETGCDGVMVGKGALGNPWLVEEIEASFRGRQCYPPSLTEKEELIKQHMEMEMQHYGTEGGIRNFRKHLLWYTKGLPGGAKFRQSVVDLRDVTLILSELHKFILDCENLKSAAAEGGEI